MTPRRAAPGAAAAPAQSAPAETPAPEQTQTPQPVPGPPQQEAAQSTQSSGAVLSQEEIERLLAANSASGAAQPAQPATPPAPVQTQAAPVQPVYVPDQPAYAPDPKVISTKPVQLPPLDAEERLGKEQADNLEMIMSVPLEISVEIGRTRRKVEDILALSKGSLVVLDKLAGDQVDLFVNGLCVARGDVVVIDDNFGVRITEVLKRTELFNKN